MRTFNITLTPDMQKTLAEGTVIELAFIDQDDKIRARIKITPKKE